MKRASLSRAQPGRRSSKQNEPRRLRIAARALRATLRPSGVVPLEALPAASAPCSRRRWDPRSPRGPRSLFGNRAPRAPSVLDASRDLRHWSTQAPRDKRDRHRRGRLRSSDQGIEHGARDPATPRHLRKRLRTHPSALRRAHGFEQSTEVGRSGGAHPESDLRTTCSAAELRKPTPRRKTASR